jgi:hypothetical protein
MIMVMIKKVMMLRVNSLLRYSANMPSVHEAITAAGILLVDLIINEVLVFVQI